MKSVTLTQAYLDKLQSKLDEATKNNQKVKLVVKEDALALVTGKF